MPTKAKPKTGGAVPDDSQPEITDAQAAEIGPGSAGFVAAPSPPGASGPSYGMGGEVTQPSDFAREVAASTNVPSKGGPPIEDLYASSGKGPVGKLTKPSKTNSTTKAPEDKIAPSAPAEIGPGSAGFVAVPQGTPAATPGATPGATPAQPTDQGTAQPDQGKPEQLPAFQNHGDMITKYAQPYQSGDQDYSRLSPYIREDPTFAGTINGVPIFMDNDNRPYYRDESSPGKGVRHYFDSPAGSKEAESGVSYENTDQIAAAQAGREQMQGMLQTQEAINSWKQKLAQYQATHGDEAWWQRAAVEAKMSGDTGWQATLAKAAAGLAGVTPDMEALDAARQQLTVPYLASFAKGKEGLRIPSSEVQGMPTANDDFMTQLTKVRAMEQKLQAQAVTLRKIYPNASQQSDKLLQMIESGSAGSGQQEGRQNVPTASTARPTATPAPTATPSQAPDVTGDADAYAKLKVGDPFVYKGKTYHKQ